MSGAGLLAGATLFEVSPLHVDEGVRIGFLHEDKAAALGRLMAVDGQRDPIKVVAQPENADQPWRLVEVSQIAAGLQGGAGPALRAFDAGLRYLPANFSALVRAPLNLAGALLGLVNAVALLGSAPRVRIAGLSRMLKLAEARDAAAA